MTETETGMGAVPRTAAELAQYLGCAIEGDAEVKLRGVSNPERASPEELIYVDSPRNLDRAERSAARCAITTSCVANSRQNAAAGAPTEVRIRARLGLAFAASAYCAGNSSDGGDLARGFAGARRGRGAFCRDRRRRRGWSRNGNRRILYFGTEHEAGSGMPALSSRHAVCRRPASRPGDRPCGRGARSRRVRVCDPRGEAPEIPAGGKSGNRRGLGNRSECHHRPGFARRDATRRTGENR